MAFPRAPAEVPRPPAPPLTCSSSHHMLTPALATALVSLAPTILPLTSNTCSTSDGQKYSLPPLAVRRL